MKKVIMLFVFFAFQIINSQELLMDFELVSSPDVTSPKFNGGGVEKFYEFINKEFDFNKVKKAGNMNISFVVNEFGLMKNIRITQFPDLDSANEMFRVFDLAPKWESAVRAGKPFSTTIKIPIKFNYKINSNHTTTINELDHFKSPQINGDTFPETEKPIPTFSGGMTSFLKFIMNNYRVPDVEGLKGKIFVSFIVDVDGSLIEIKVIKDIGYGTGEEAIRVLKLSPKWTPGILEGKPVKCEYSLPINIQSAY